MQTPTSHVTELLNAGWLVPNVLQSALSDYLQALTTEPKPKTIEQVEAKLWADYEDDNDTPTPTEALKDGETIWIIDMDSVMYRSSYRMYGAAYYADVLQQAYADASCKGVLLRFGNCMGGERKASYMVADAVRLRNKPVVGYTEYGCAYSGHYLAICECDEVICSNETDSVGSIGAYISFVDTTASDAAWGYKRNDIYAESSPDKNKPIREAKKGNLKLLEQEAERIALQFQERVIQARGAKLTSDIPLRGGDFDAPQALEYGLIDRIGQMDIALARVLKLSSNFSNQTQNNNMFGFMKAPAVLALENIAASDITQDQLNAAVAELQGSKLGGFVELLQSFGQTTTTPVDVKASVEYKALEAKLTAETVKTAQLTTKLEGYEKPGDEVTNPVKKEEKIAGSGDKGDELLSEADVQMRALWANK